MSLSIPPSLTPGTSLEDIYTRFNIDHPKDFKGHSLSVSDVVVLHQNGQDAAHYVDSAFGKCQSLQEQSTYPTTRGGRDHVTSMNRSGWKPGYGFHHRTTENTDMGMDAGVCRSRQQTILKTAEQTTEQNENMIDGIINNTPTVDELEAKVKAGEQISLVDLANAVKADKERGKGAKPEKKPSIRAQLKADKEKAREARKAEVTGLGKELTHGRLSKFEDVDVFASLNAVMKQNTGFYQSDFDIDKEIIAKAAASPNREDKTLLWFCRPSGTHCFPGARRVS